MQSEKNSAKKLEFPIFSVILKSAADTAEVLHFRRNIIFTGKTTAAVFFLQRRQRKKEKKKRPVRVTLECNEDYKEKDHTMKKDKEKKKKRSREETASSKSSKDLKKQAVQPEKQSAFCYIEEV